ncbi:hypothetical protein EAI_13939 [Harpegnathos saltator]|uniref:Uncharacterized protein n=1 Tax=Harpegnathos saltator TaxID=610380 RepID=E2C252_HARSA|nr:hypothetical protein EAI_13939 [Harpegnathos saltator]
MVRIDWASHCGFVQEKTSPCGGGARTLHSAPNARGPQKEGTVRFKVAVSGSPYLSWLEKIRKENPAFLTIVSLELPESPIPLIESQANARWKRDEPNEVASEKDDILDEFLVKVTKAGKEREKESLRAARNYLSRKSQRSGKRRAESLECTKALATLEECTRNIVEGPSREGLSRQDVGGDCICSEVPRDLRINIRKRTTTEITRPPRTPSPEVTHTIRIAMKYHDRSAGRAVEDDESLEEEDGVAAAEEETADGRTKNEGSKKDLQGLWNARKEPMKQDGCCVGVKAALDFTLNCNSVRLTSRDTSLKTTTRSERQEQPETRTRWYSTSEILTMKRNRNRYRSIA